MEAPESAGERLAGVGEGSVTGVGGSVPVVEASGGVVDASVPVVEGIVTRGRGLHYRYHHYSGR